jgi:hypothetical protein
LPLVLFTSLGRREVNTQGIEFAAFLHKPLKPSHLYNVLISLFAEQEQAQPALRTAWKSWRPYSGSTMKNPHRLSI